MTPKAGRAAGIRVRPYVAGDLDAVIAIFQRAVREVACRDYDPAQIEAWSHVERDEWAPWRLSRPAWVAEVAGEPVGFSDLEPDGHLDMMFVHPAHQGQGVATALLERIEAEARTLGLFRLHLEASITARPFFERRGFRLLAPQTVELRDQCLVNFLMEKPLSGQGPQRHRSLQRI